MKHLSYTAILRQRLVVAGLTLGLITVMIGVGIDIYLKNTQSTIPGSTRALTQPLNPQLDVATVERLESYETVTTNGARVFVRQLLDQQAQQEEQAVQEALQELGLQELAENPGGQNEPAPEGSEETISPFIPEEEVNEGGGEQTPPVDTNEQTTQ